MNLARNLTFLVVSSFPLTALSQSPILVFRTQFDYTNGVPIIEEIAGDLDGADDQVGTFSGFLPLGADGLGGEQLITIRNSNEDPEGTYLVADRGTEDFAFSANFTDPVELGDTRVSFKIGTNRTGTDHNKDNQIIGFSSTGEEVFHLWVSARNDTTADGLRLGYEATDTDGIVWDLPTFGLGDRSGDIGFFNGDITDEDVTTPASISLTLGVDGYEVNFVSGSSGGDGSGFFSLYTTLTLSYNGPGSDLARVEFRGEGGDNNDVRSGFWLDDISVLGTFVPQPPFVLRITDIDFDSESRNATISFTSEEDARYQVSRSEDLLTWTPMNVPLVRVGSESFFTDPDIAEGIGKRFYRVSEVAN